MEGFIFSLSVLRNELREVEFHQRICDQGKNDEEIVLRAHEVLITVFCGHVEMTREKT